MAMDVLFWAWAAVAAQGTFSLGLACMLGLLLQPVAGRRSTRPAACLVPRNCAWVVAHLLYLLGHGRGPAILPLALAWPVWTEGLASLPLGLIPTQGRRLAPRWLGLVFLGGHCLLLGVAFYSGYLWLAEATVAIQQAYNGWVLWCARHGLQRRLCQARLCTATRQVRRAANGRGAYVITQLRLMCRAYRGGCCLYLSYLAVWLVPCKAGSVASAWRVVAVAQVGFGLACLQLLLCAGQLWNYHSARVYAKHARAARAAWAAGLD